MATPLDPDLLARPVTGRCLPAATFGEVLGPGPTLVAVLRHPG